MIEACFEVPGRKADGERHAATLGQQTSDPEVLSGLAFVLAEAGAAPYIAINFAEQAAVSVQAQIRDARTPASDIPMLNRNLMMIQDALGWSLYRAGEPSRAVNVLYDAMQAGYPEVDYHYGMALLEVGKTYDAA